MFVGAVLYPTGQSANGGDDCKVRFGESIGSEGFAGFIQLLLSLSLLPSSKLQNT